VTVLRRQAVRRITAPRQERINRLAEVLYNFLPLSSRSAKVTTFRTIFGESGIEDYLEEENKRAALQTGLTGLFRYHERLPFAVIRKIVPAAIEYRRYVRTPLRRAELNAVSDCLADLGVDMRRELADTELDETLPRITVPPKELEERLRKHDLHEAIASEPLELFSGGHFNEAVRRAAERFEDQVRERSGINDHGRSLMGRVFGAGVDRLAIEGMQPENEVDFQNGFKLLAMGLMGAIRNVFSHGDEERREPEECFEMLMFTNWLFRNLEKAVKT